MILAQTELHMYGSSRIGIYNVNIDVTNTANISPITIFTRGNKFFELSNHLGNVLVTVSDKKLQHSSNNSSNDYYLADVVTANDYYPFGMAIPGRQYTQANSGYRYGFNGLELDNEIYSEGNAYTAEFWEYNPGIGRRWNLEPEMQKYPWNSPYSTFNNNPILNKDPNGKDPITAIFEGVTAFAIEAGLDFLTNLITKDGSVEESFNAVNWKGAAWEGAKATAISAFLPTGTQTAARLAKIGQSKIGKLTASFVSNLVNEAFKNYLKGDYDENGSFSFDKLQGDFTNLTTTAGITTLLDAGLGGKAEKLFEKLKKSNSKLSKEYEKLFKSLGKPSVKQEVITNRIKKINEAAKKLGKDAAKAVGAKAKDETIKKAADETQKKARGENKE